MKMADKSNGRKLLMEALLTEHYEEVNVKKSSECQNKRKYQELGVTESSRTIYNNQSCKCEKCEISCLNDPEYPFKRSKNGKTYTSNKKCYTCDLCDYNSTKLPHLKTHMKVHIVGDKMEYEYFLPSVNPIACRLLTSRTSSEKKTFYKTEIVKRISRRSLPSNQLEQLFPSEQLLFFIPQTKVDDFSDFRKWKNKTVTFKEIRKQGQAFQNLYSAKFSGKVESILIAENADEAMDRISQEKLIIFSKRRFQMIQNLSHQLTQRPFCEYINTQLPKASKTKPNQGENKEEVEVYKCPIAKCNFVTHKKFTGVRIHLTQHFKNQIRANAKPKTDIQFIYEETPTCLAKWVCSIPQLEASGDLVHHYGILHSLVDIFFIDFATRIIFETDKNSEPSCCFCDNLNFADRNKLTEHLTVDHYFHLIEEEIGNKILFKKSGDLSVEHKCPFCNRKFENNPGSYSRDITELVKHCGLDHGFTFYHAMVGKEKKKAENKEVKLETESLVEIETDSKQEVFDENDYSIKVEPSENGELKVEKFITVSQEDLCKDDDEIESSEEPFFVSGDLNYCRFCDFESLVKYPQIMKDHISKKHERLPFTCQICSAKFKLKKNLQSHIISHAPNTKFQCDQCEYVDYRLTTFRYHRKTQHSLGTTVIGKELSNHIWV